MNETKRFETWEKHVGVELAIENWIEAGWIYRGGIRIS